MVANNRVNFIKLTIIDKFFANLEVIFSVPRVLWVDIFGKLVSIVV